jgi:hypothetical protein
MKFFIIYFLFTIADLYSGCCPESIDFYLSIISNFYYNDIEYYYYRDKDGITVHKIDLRNLDQVISCLHPKLGDYVMGYEYFASPTVMKKIKLETEKYKDKVYKYLVKYINFTNLYLGGAAIITLAYYGWPESYEYLINLRNPLGRGEVSPTLKATLFAILGEKRAVKWIIEKYKEVDKKYIKRPDFSYPDKMVYLNALYHIGSEECLEFLEEIIKNPRPKKIKLRAIKVRDRILELNRR